MLLDCWVACRPGAGQQRPPSYRRPARLGAEERSGARKAPRNYEGSPSYHSFSCFSLGFPRIILGLYQDLL